MAKAKKLPSGNYRVRASYTDEDGVKHTESFTDSDPRIAEAKAAMWKAGMLKKEKERSSVPLSAALEQYVDTCRCAGMSPTTIRMYDSVRRNHFKAIAHRAVDRLTVRDVQKWINDLSSTLAPKTIRNALGMLSVTLKANGVKLDMDGLKLPTAKRQEVEIVSDADLQRLLDEIEGDDDLYIAVCIASLMGLRRSEICALTWSDILVASDGKSVLSVNKALVLDENNDHVIKDPKTYAGRRMLVIPDDLYAKLKSRRQLRPTLVGSTPDAISHKYARVAERLGLPTRFHALRHYHASVMLRKGVQQKYICADMGHSSFDMVERVYGHVMSEELPVIDSAMSAHASSILNARCHENCHAVSEM